MSDDMTSMVPAAATISTSIPDDANRRSTTTPRSLSPGGTRRTVASRETAVCSTTATTA
jgi:hypothetical protein